EIYQMNQKLVENEFIWAAIILMQLVLDVKQVLTVLLVYMINERIYYEYRITYFKSTISFRSNASTQEM
ncbi:hypothetical protein ACTHS7_13865, partial [Neisseria sp. P0015.S009]|uniref:hypothetical protein n=1 Tax=Neisseria sp. P0015.S009 TaxID=3436765 RepID=UPI003F800879